MDLGNPQEKEKRKKKERTAAAMSSSLAPCLLSGHIRPLPPQGRFRPFSAGSGHLKARFDLLKAETDTPAKARADHY